MDALLLLTASPIVVIGVAFLSYKLGHRSLLILVPVAAVLIYGLLVYSGESSAALTSIVGPLVVGAAGGLAFKYRMSFDVYLVLTTLLLMALFSGNFYYETEVKGLRVLEKSRQEMMKLVDISSLSKEKKEEIERDFDYWISIAPDIIPFSSFLYGLFFSALGYLIIRALLIRFAGANPVLGFEFFRLNEYSVFGLIAGIAVLLFIERSDYRLIYAGGLNVTMILALLYALQGISIIRYMVISKGLPSGIVFVLIVFTVLLGPTVLAFALVLFSGLGTLDIWADFRKLTGPAKKDE